MKITKVQQFMLFILGQYYKEINRRYKTPFLKVTVSKVVFIGLARKSGIVLKQPRAIYKNLEFLEKRKYIKYEHKMLKFTPKGKKQFEKMNKYLQPYLDVVDKIKKGNYKKSKSGGQMIFSR